jgi:hypothetical protein
MFNHIQFSNLRLASNHINAQATGAGYLIGRDQDKKTGRAN